MLHVMLIRALVPRCGLADFLMLGKVLRTWLLLMFCLLIQACVTPVSQLTELAIENGLERTKERAGGFDLLVFSNQSSREARQSQSATVNDDTVLHVYLEGDGSPWRYRVIVMPDPTPRNPLMLRLMSKDANPAVYVGRPCYNGFASEPDCDSSIWTSARYSGQVVNSMASVISGQLERHGAEQLWLIGHSGGGALAMLIASKVPQVTRVVTIAGNLDIDAWTRHHRYTPLFSSINPATEPALSPEIWQWHLIGGRDQVVPAQLVKPVILRQPSASGFELASFNHGCCWERIWPTVLQALANDDPTRIPGRQFKFRQAPASALDSQ